MQETQKILYEEEKVTQEALSEREQDMQGALSDPEEETKERPSDREVETQVIIPEHKQDEAGPSAGSTELGGPVVPALRKLNISGNLPQIM